MADLANDPEACFDFLVDHEVFVERDGEVAVTERFDAVRGIYHDTYGDAPDSVFHATVGSLFGLTPEAASERIEELGVTREELVSYLALQSHLEDVAPAVDLARPVRVQMAAMISGVAPASPVPRDMTELADEDYGAFLDAHDDAVVFVWKRHCEPCDAMKADLDAILAALPDGVAVAGVDGEAVSDFRREFEVSAAPATLTFADGAFVEKVEGRRSPSQLSEMFAVAYGSSPALD